ncbi:MAG: response regulator [Deltaproteobacteria bacterium]|nr:response regulator [Deltaproteobacteria bacterium]
MTLATTEGTPFDIIFRIVRPDGEIRWMHAIGTTTKDEKDNVTKLFGTAQDITERKRAEEEKNKLETQLQQSQKMEAVGTLAGGIAHDFNNILAVILGNTELASDDVPDSNPASKSLKAIHQASIRAKDMVRQLLAFSRKSDEESKPLDIAPVIKESMKMLRHAIPTSVEFKQHISDAFCNVMGDAAQINQIVMNLVTNAAHAMSEEGGLLEVTLEHIILQKEKACFDWVLSPGSYVRLRMKDTGEGIEPKIMDRIFDPYFTTKDVGKGTGMGLSVIHGIVKRHGGGILVESELGKGTVFEIYFPALGETAEVEKEPLGEIKGGSERILFVDDEESMVDLNRQRLERLGYNVKSTIKPVEALEWFKADPDQFDVIITDMTMPRMTGDRLAAEVLKIRPHMPVIICTGYSERMSAKKAEVLGVSKYIEKPIGARNLASAIREVLDEK